jgi:hypothetical protein
MNYKGFKITNNQGVKMRKFSFRIGYIEARSCDVHLRNSDPHVRAEIVNWNGATCFTLASWREKDEDWGLEFCGKRPFLVNDTEFMLLARLGQEELERNKREE